VHAKASIDELTAHLKASYKLIHLCTQEEQRAEEHLLNLARGPNPRDYFAWTATDGIKDSAGRATGDCKSPEKALDWVIQRERQTDRPTQPAIYVFKDLHPFISGRSADGKVLSVRKLKDTIHALQGTKSACILLSPEFDIPVELEKEIVIIDFKLPSADELRERFAALIAEYTGKQGVDIRLSEKDVGELAQATRGLTLNEAVRAFGKIFTQNRGKLGPDDIHAIADEKKQIVRKKGLLTIEDPVRMEDVGGLEILMEWLRKRKDIFTEEARKYGLHPPKGVMLTGVPGCGKSLCARAMASFWNIPLLRLDMGSVFGSYIGTSEANMRGAIKTAEAMAPCILFIDEIEKGLAGMSGGGGSDSGTGSRVFGTLLSWMNDKIAPVFVVATSNQFDRLPPEMLRKGRFDELFFVDFPHANERRQIFRIHIRKVLARRQPPLNDQELEQATAGFDLNGEHTIPHGTKDGNKETLRGSLIQLSHNFNGAEIEEAIKTAMIEAFADGRRAFEGADIAHAIANTVPLIDTMGEKIEAIRARSRECTVRASRYSAGEEEPVLVETSPTASQPKQPPSSSTRGGRPLFDLGDS